MAYDIIADIHGYAATLEELLRTLGYERRKGVWAHPARTALFLGDFIDRGPRQVDTYRIARAMVESGSALAVMGNHEFNAIAWTLRDPDRPGRYLRDHDDENKRRQTRKFLGEAGEGSALHAEIIAWFWQLPLWLELDDLLVVHAVWDPQRMDALKPLLAPGNKLSAEAINHYAKRGSEAWDAIETILKGLEARLPDPCSFTDKDGHTRHEIRLKWWETGPSSWRQAALMPQEVVDRLPDLPVEIDLRRGHHDRRPVFIGHYALSGRPFLTASNVACLDFSVISEGGCLCAYRWDGESKLDAGRLRHVPVAG